MGDNLIVFLGRFHPLIVHLPIGFLLMSGLLQLYSVKTKNSSINLNPAIAFTLFWGTLASIGAVAIGWLLSLQGGYDQDILFWHKWLGILVTLLSFFGWLLKKQLIRLQKNVYSIVLISVIALISVSGHLGGSLTHGEAYLMLYAPEFIKDIVGMETNEKGVILTEIHEDSIQVFPHIIQPIFDNKCTSCHNTTNKKGGLLLTSYKELMAGGDHGSILNLKTPLESELLNRVTLPKSHKKFMPPRGTPFTFGEIQIIEWWMKSGADSNATFSAEQYLDSELIHTLLRDYQLDYNPKPHYEKVKVEVLKPDLLTQLEQYKFSINFMGEHSNMISITFKEKFISNEQIEKLVLAKDQITWLNLSNCKLLDSQLKTISNFKNLTKLNLHSNPITDKGIKELTGLNNLTSLNLYNTKISNTGLNELAQLKSINTIYVWKTAITTAEIEEISRNHPRLSIVSGLN